MNTNKRLNWSEIDITSDDTGNDKETKTFKVNLNDDDIEEADNGQKTEDTRRSNFTVSKNNNENKEDKNNKARTESEEDQEERAVSSKQTRETEVDDEETPRKGGRAQRRIQNLTRIKNEQETLIQRLARENQELKTRTRETEKRSAISQRDAYKQALDDTETQLEQAIAGNDTAKVAKLTKQIADLTMRANAYTAVAEEFENYKEEEHEDPRGQQVAPEVPDEAKSWIKRNPWFFQDEKKHVLARMISREITGEGVYDPNEEEYWQELDKRLGEYGVKSNTQEKEAENREESQKKVPQRKGPVSSSRNDEDGGSYDFNSDPQFKRSGNRVTANPTKSDYDMAERLGVKIEDLMKEKYKYAQQGYTGYVPIDVPG